MDQPNPAPGGKFILLLVCCIKASVLHVTEGILQTAVLIDAPDQGNGKLMHNRVFDEQLRPARRTPLASCHERLLQAQLLVGYHGFKLLFHLLEGRVGRPGRFLIIAFPGRGQIF